ncbi:5-formyltetrahydrofolate cyclo-ligase [Metabacillus sp. HB246100]
MLNNKNQIRTYIKKILSEMDELAHKNSSQSIHTRLFLTDYWTESNVIAITVSRGREIETIPIIQKAWSEQKKVLVPKCYPKTNEMEFREITSLHQLEQVYFGLSEPKVQVTNLVLPNQIDLIIVPGVCFDQKGYRIGYGGGYYDRYLEAFRGRTLSLSFRSQIVDEVPREAHDRAVQLIVTEDEVIHCDRND